VNLRLRPLRLDDEADFRAAHSELAADGFPFGFMEPGTTFAEHVRRTAEHRRGRDLPPGFVESSFLVADVAGDLVGRTSIRHVLNDALARHGGHIGYAVRPAFRRRGYASEILRQSLVIVRSYGVERVLVTCNDTNVGSAAVIEACGGELERIVPASASDDGVAFRRYWIT
jgi:predicted acetyltransferase